MISKSYTKSRHSCRVTFKVPAESKAKTACLCGDFNDWSETSHPMKRNKDGSFTKTIYLDTGQEYRFRYLLDNKRWENEEEADGFIPNPFGSDDSILKL